MGVVKTVNCDKLRLHIYVVGGKGSGEAIVVVVHSDNTAVFSMLIDCCTVTIDGTEVVLPLKILHRHHINTVDCIVWTHPHDDHSVGMETLINKCYSKKTLGLLPKQLYGDKRNIVQLTDCCKKVLKAFNHTFKRTRLKSIDCMESEKRTLIELPIADYETGKVKMISLFCLSPLAEKLDDKVRNEVLLSQSQLNELSLTLVLSIDNYCFYFGGDAPDAVINKFNRDIVGQCRWIKIPHHGSLSSMKLTGLLGQPIDSAACTAFLSQGLPNDIVMKEYLNKTPRLFVTQKFQEDANPLGIIEYEYSFEGASIALNIRCYGNAYKKTIDD